MFKRNTKAYSIGNLLIIYTQNYTTVLLVKIIDCDQSEQVMKILQGLGVVQASATKCWPSSYAEILGETKFQPREFLRSRSKAEDVKEGERESESQ